MIDYEKFNEELDDCGDDIELWKARKAAENDSFYGIELDPAKVEKWNKLTSMAKSLSKLHKSIKFFDEPLENTARHGYIAIEFPSTFFSSDSRISKLLARLFYNSDDFFLSSMKQIDDPEEIERIAREYGAIDGGRIKITFVLCDMWSIFGKAPF